MARTNITRYVCDHCGKDIPEPSVTVFEIRKNGEPYRVVDLCPPDTALAEALFQAKVAGGLI